MGEDEVKPELHDREHVGLTGGMGGTFVGIDAKHLDVDGARERDEKSHHDGSWKTKAEEEPDDEADSAETGGA